MGILVVGSVALDSIKTPAGERADVLGGAATYFSIAASYFTDVSMVAVVGEDFPEAHLALLRRKGIDISGLQRRGGKTFRWKGEYGSDLNSRTTLETHLNVFADFSPKLSEAQRRHKYLFLGNIDPDLQRYILDQMENPKFVACDTMNFWIESKRDALLKIISRVNLLVINDAETRQLADKSNVIQAARSILHLGPNVIVVKRGEYGALMLDSKSVFGIPAFPVENVVDPTGAGDSFAGGLMGYLANVGMSDDAALRRAVVFGSVMASFNITDFGPRQLADLTFTEIAARYREFHKLTCFENLE